MEIRLDSDPPRDRVEDIGGRRPTPQELTGDMRFRMTASKSRMPVEVEFL
ncbi:hypothetical protein ABIB26_003782 [Arthrobacter sp. UYEF20]